MNFKQPITIKGNGTSLWGQSRGTWEITKIVIGEFNLQLFGPETVWQQYTDDLIEKEVTEKFRSRVEKALGVKIKKIEWSEQGMQPAKGWDFDIIRAK